MLSTPAFNALLKILEEPPEHLMFILATTELHKVPATIKSRCQQFAFKRISPADITGRLQYVAGEEGIPLTAEGAALLARLADGGMRDALSLLDQCAVGREGQLGEPEILAALGLAGNVETAALLGEIARRDTGAVLEHMDRLYAAGKEVGSLLNELASLIRDLLIRKTAPRGGAGLMTGGYDEQTLRGLSETLNTPRLALLLGQLQKTGADLGRSANRRVDAELCLIRLCDESLDDSTAGLNARMARLEELAKLGNVAQRSLEEKPQTPVAPVEKPAPPLEEPVKRSPPAPQPEAIPPRPEPAPAQVEEAPPWDMEPPPMPEEPPAPARPVSPPPPVRRPEPPAAPPRRQAPPVSGGFWPRLTEALRGRVPMGEYSFLSNPIMVQGTLDGPQLTLWTQSELVKGMISKPGILAVIGKVAQELTGDPCRAVVTVGEPPAPSPAAPVSTGGPEPEEEHDKLDDLLALGEQFGDIITEE